ncbi:MAG TPA: hypothetical protein PLJ38_09540, partial [bacterium]|nr:hypothetical protein [bacterium]
MKKIFFLIFLLVFANNALSAQNNSNIMTELAKVYQKNLRLRNFTPSNIVTIDSSILASSVKVDTIYYRSDDLKITGLLFRPKDTSSKNINFKKGIVIAHGYYPVQYYYPGMGTFMTGEKLAKDGYIVIIPDYRGYYQSEGRNNYPYPGES